MQNGQVLQSSLTTPESQTPQSAESKRLYSFNKHGSMRFWMTCAGVLLAGNAILIFLGLHAKNARVSSNSTVIKTQQVDTQNLSPAASSFTVENDRVVINGQLQANKNLVLTPANQPSSAQFGEVYIDAKTKVIRFYNGKTFISLADADTLNNLQAQQQALSSGIVTSLQGVAGALSLTGTGGLTISTSGTNISLKLPQNLTTTASPTFSGLTLTHDLSVANGGTGRSSFAANGVIISDNVGALQSLTESTAGLCLVSGVGPGGEPGFMGCNGTTSVSSLDGQTGDLTLANSSATDASTITIDDASTSVKGIATFNNTNFSASSGAINTIQNIATTSSPTFAGLTLTTAPLGLASGGTGATNATGARTQLSAAKSGGNSDITSTTALNTITPNASLTVGSTSQAFTLQGNASSVMTATNSGFTTTVGFSGTPTGDVRYNFDQSASPGVWVVCTTAGNCNGAGGVTSSGGTNGTIALFTGSQSIGNSILTQSGSTINIADTGGTAGALSFENPANSNIVKLQAGTTSSNLTFTLPTSGGSSGQCLTTSGGSSATLSFTTCLSGAGGGGDGVASLDGLSGALTLANSSGSGSTITIENAAADASTKGIATFNSTNFSALSGVINTVQGISTSASPTFAGLTLTGDLTLGTAGTAFTNNVQQTANGQDISINAGNDAINFTANGITFILPSTGGASQTICTTGISCVAGGGQAVLLAPGAAQTDSTADASIFLNDTGGGNLLQLRSGGADKFVVANDGTLSVDTITTFGASPGDNSLTFNANGISFILPSTGGASQTICTTGISCVAGGGQAVLLAPGSAQTNASNTDASIFVSNTGSAKLLELQSSGSDVFAVNNNGSTTITGGTLSVTGLSSGIATVGGGGTLSSVSVVPIANGGTNASTAATARSNLGAAASGSNSDITSTSALNTITPNGVLTVGATNQQFTLQGSSASTVTATSGSFKTSVGFATPTANVNYNFATTVAGTYDICTSAGNCVGTGGGVTTSGGTSGTIALFTGSQAIGNSILSQSGSTITISDTGGTAGALSFKNPTNSNVIKLQAGTTSSNLTFTLPTADGTPGQCLTTNGSGGLSFLSCLSGGSGVSSLDGQSGALTLLNSSAPSSSTIQIDNASTSQKGIAMFNSTNFSDNGSGTINTIQNIATSSSPTFAGLTLTTTPLAVASGGTGASTASGARSNLGAAASGANADITSTTALNTITPSGTLTVGSLTQNLNLQGGTHATSAITMSTGSAAGTAGGITIGNTSGANTQAINIGTNATASSTTNLVLGSTVAGTTTLQSAGGVIVSTLGAANNLTYLCRNSSNIISTCNTAGNGAAFVQGGNTFGAQAILGTNDSNSLAFETNNTTRLTLNTSGSLIYAGGSGNFDQSASTGTFATGSGAVSLNGNITASGTYNTNTFTSSNLQFGAAGTATVQSASSQALNITGKAASTFSTTSGDLTLQAGSGTVKLGTSTALTANGALSISSGGALTVGSAGQNLTLQGNTTILKSATAGATLTINSTGAQAVNSGLIKILTGDTSLANSGALTVSTGATQIGNSGDLNLTTGQANPGISGSIIISSGFTSDSGSASGDILIGTGANDGGGGSGQVLIQNGNDGTASFQVQNTFNQNILTADTQGDRVVLGQNGAIAGKLVLAGSTSNGFTIIPGSTTGAYTLTTAATAGGPFTLTLPAATGTVCITTGNCLGGVGGGANDTLSNLVSPVAINQSLLVVGGSGNTFDLGSTGTRFRSGYFGTTVQATTSVLSALFDSAAAGTLNVGTSNATTLNIGNSGTTTINLGSASASSNTINVGAAGNSIQIGSTSGAGITRLRSGSGGMVLDATGNITIGQSTGTTDTIDIAGEGVGQAVIHMGNTSSLTSIYGINGVRLYIGSGGSKAICSSAGNANALQVINDCTSAPVADYSEMYPAANNVSVGDVVTQGSSQIPTYNTNANGNVDWTSVKGTVSQVIKATKPYDASLLGIASDNYADFTSAGYNIKQSDNPKAVALNGRVLVKISTENGDIAAGDFLTASATLPGYAMKATKAGYVIGQALAPFTGSSGMVMVFVGNQYYPGPTTGSMIQNGGDASLANLDVSGSANVADLNVSGATTLANLTVTGSATLAKLTVNGSSTFNGTLSVNGHIISGGANPTITKAASCGAGCTATISGSDTAGIITIHTGTGADSGTLATVTFANAYGSGPTVVLTPKDIPAASTYPEYYYDSNTTTFELKVYTALTDSKIYSFSYHIIQ